MGDHWQPDLSGPTPLGKLVTRAKDARDPDAVEELCTMIEDFVLQTRPLSGHPSLGTQASVVAAVPPNPSTAAHLAVHLAESVGNALGLTANEEIIVRHHTTARLRDTDPALRRGLAESAGYEVTRPLDGATVVLVDDVILTGTTVGLIAELLLEAGAANIEVVVASRTQRRV